MEIKYRGQVIIDECALLLAFHLPCNSPMPLPEMVSWEFNDSQIAIDMRDEELHDEAGWLCGNENYVQLAIWFDRMAMAMYCNSQFAKPYYIKYPHDVINALSDTYNGIDGHVNPQALIPTIELAIRCMYANPFHHDKGGFECYANCKYQPIEEAYKLQFAQP